jgi:hypothetical protein
VFNGNGDTVVPELVAIDDGLVTVSTPDTMIALKHPVSRNAITAERHFNPVSRGIRKIIIADQVVITAPAPVIHSGLARPKKKTITAMGDIIPVKNIPATLFIHQDTGAILAPVVYSMAIASHVEDYAIMQDLVSAAPV